jgi:hypothetical protein
MPVPKNPKKLEIGTTPRLKELSAAVCFYLMIVDWVAL